MLVPEAKMETNHVPKCDLSKTEPDCCCPKFDPAPWDGLELHFRDKPFVRGKTISLFHIPLNMGDVFTRTFDAIKAANAEEDEFVVLSDDSSKWRGEHFFAVKHEVPGADNVKLTGDYLTHVFEGPYRNAPVWAGEMKKLVSGRGKKMMRLFFFYTTCPKCAARIGKNYVVGIAQVG
jgi:hypothetical protein